MNSNDAPRLDPTPIAGEWGPVLVDVGGGEVRVAYYDDDDENDDDVTCAIVYFSPPEMMILTGRYALIPYGRLSRVTTPALFQRRRDLYAELFAFYDDAVRSDESDRLDAEASLELIGEWMYIEQLLAERMFEAQFRARAEGRRVFVSHSSLDKQMATALAVDLTAEGHRPWFDEWEIRVGESIPHKVAVGTDACDAVIVLLSPRAIESRWVENEWASFFARAMSDPTVQILPALMEDCEIPSILRHLKYADLRSDYAAGLEQILRSLA